MNRRHALMGLAATGAALPLVQAAAQTATVPSVSITEYMAKTLMGGTAAKQTSELALEKGQSRAVKQFATFEIAEQTAVAQVLTNTANPPPVPLDAEHAAILSSLQSLSGPAFDRAYVLNQIQMHDALLVLQQGYLENTSRSTDGQHIAVLARVSIQQHLAMLRDLQQTLAG